LPEIALVAAASPSKARVRGSAPRDDAKDRTQGQGEADGGYEVLNDDVARLLDTFPSPGCGVIGQPVDPLLKTLERRLGVVGGIVTDRAAKVGQLFAQPRSDMGGSTRLTRSRLWTLVDY
jgi:hypothetical protein